MDAKSGMSVQLESMSLTLLTMFRSMEMLPLFRGHRKLNIKRVRGTGGRKDLIRQNICRSVTKDIPADVFELLDFVTVLKNPYSKQLAQLF